MCSYSAVFDHRYRFYAVLYDTANKHKNINLCQLALAKQQAFHSKIGSSHWAEWECVLKLLLLLSQLISSHINTAYSHFCCNCFSVYKSGRARCLFAFSWWCRWRWRCRWFPFLIAKKFRLIEWKRAVPKVVRLIKKFVIKWIMLTFVEFVGAKNVAIIFVRKIKVGHPLLGGMIWIIVLLFRIYWCWPSMCKVQSDKYKIGRRHVWAHIHNIKLNACHKLERLGR